MNLFSANGIFFILFIALLLFGPEKLPQLGRMAGRFMAEFKRAQESVEATIKAEMYRAEGGGDGVPAATTAAPAFTPTASDEDEEEDEE